MSQPRTFLDGRVVLHAGDCHEVLRGMAENSIDSVVVDPPYHLTSIVKRFGGKNAAPVKEYDPSVYGGAGNPFKRGATGFMGKQWDGGDIAFQPELWAEVLRVLRPGGYIMAFSGCRTYHRMACAIEDAGFITHPMFAWCFGSGFPKAHNLSKQLDRMAGVEREVIGRKLGRAATPVQDIRGGSYAGGNGKNGAMDCSALTAPATDAAREWDGWFYGTQSLKPAIEPVYFGQKPFERGLNGAQNVMKWGVGAINVGGCRVPSSDERSGGFGLGNRPWQSGNVGGNTQYVGAELGRWPANLILDGSDEVLACFPERYVNTPSSGGYAGEGWGFKPQEKIQSYENDGSAARFFASFPQEPGPVEAPADRETRSPFTLSPAELSEDIRGKSAPVKRIIYTSKAGADDRLGSKHPTVKPLDLIQYFARLITPPGKTCLDLFAGTGTTGEACFREGFRCILIENDPESIADIERRMSLVMDGPDTRAYASQKARNRPRDDGPLFGFEEKIREPNLSPSASPRRPYADDTAIWGGHIDEAAE